MKLLLDMNFSPQWVPVLERHEWEARHWSAVGDPCASDYTIMDWAREHEFVILTHDLDFGAILAVTHGLGPSVIQVRTQDVTPNRLEPILVRALRQYQSHLEVGALITVDANRLRARILPLVD